MPAQFPSLASGPSALNPADAAGPCDKSAVIPGGTACTGVLFRQALPCELSAVRDAALAARNFLGIHGVPEEDLMACELALVEAANNAVLYAAAQGRKKPVELEVLCNG